MKKKQKISLTFLILLFSFIGHSFSDSETEAKAELADALNISLQSERWVYIENYDCYALENLVYVENPVDSEKQLMNIYVPSTYMNRDGSINNTGTVNGYTSTNAPIIYIIGVGGYSEANPTFVSPKISSYLENGYVIASPGARGRQTVSEDGTKYIGKSPAALVDLKAGVRFLKANDEYLAGSSEKIISIGTSAGGALSSLLAATGNSKDYDAYLEEIGAVMPASDDVFASQIYCPITDLDHADIAYEWMFNGTSNENGAKLSEYGKAISDEIAPKYIEYLNSLGLKNPDNGELLLMGKDGRSGTMYDYLMNVIENSATKYFEYFANWEKVSSEAEFTVEDYINGDSEGIPAVSNNSGSPEGIGEMRPIGEKPDFANGEKPEGMGNFHPGFGNMMQGSSNSNAIDKTSWLSWDGEKASITSFQDMLDNYISRKKPCLSFDDFNLAQAENQEFGDENTDLSHFDTYIAPAIESLKDEYPEEYAKYYESYAAVYDDEELTLRKFLLNPFNYISGGGTDIPGNIRIRVGSQDSDTSFSISMTLALMFETYTGSVVDYEICWDQGHGDADYEGELVEWIESISK